MRHDLNLTDGNVKSLAVQNNEIITISWGTCMKECVQIALHVDAIGSGHNYAVLTVIFL